MATKRLGTNANNSLNPALAMSAANAEADMASVAQAIKDDVNVTNPVIGGSFVKNGLLYVPNRGVLIVKPGDVVGVDSTGWPVLLSANAIANGPWHFA